MIPDDIDRTERCSRHGGEFLDACPACLEEQKQLAGAAYVSGQRRNRSYVAGESKPISAPLQTEPPTEPNFQNEIVEPFAHETPQPALHIKPTVLLGCLSFWAVFFYFSWPEIRHILFHR